MTATIELLYSSCFCIGYAAYLSYVQVEASYTNPVLNVFVHLLMVQTVKGPSSGNKSSQLSRKAAHHPYYLRSCCVLDHPNLSGRHYGATPLLEGAQLTEVDHKARRRWHLAYTLLRNPQLIELRRGHTRDCSKNVDVKLTSGISLTEHSHV